MASSSSRGSPSGRKREAEAEERHREAVEERLLHLTLGKRFLEERTRLLESDARDYRLKIEELMRDGRERTEELLERNEIHERTIVELKVKSESLQILEAKLKAMTDRGAGTSVNERTVELPDSNDINERSQVELIKCESFKLLEARLKELMDKEAGPSGSSRESTWSTLIAQQDLHIST
ncbi:hypothetical protein R1sor_026974 [Riccia sorocarpa]|uniref:Uncharacterized protein n=1 Tax=Riccia sorocarpa TaxID=122646 RepID=A0ABD3GEM0_9MARC